MAAPTGSIRLILTLRKLEVYILGPVGYGTLLTEHGWKLIVGHQI